MKRLHVHVSVSNLDDSVAFYTGLFAVEPTVLKPDYAKWMLDDPRVNFAISTRSAKAGLDHLGMQVDSDDELAEVHERLEPMKAGVKAEMGTACCYAKSDKYWVTDPQGIAWETFHSLESIPVYGTGDEDGGEGAACCAPTTAAETETEGSCCAPAPASKNTTGACC